MRLWDSVKAAASGVEDDGSFDRPAGPDDCRARRAAAFEMSPAGLGLGEGWGNMPFGVVMDLAGPRGLTTVLAFANGDASLLNENGSGIIGRQSHVHVVVQAKRLVDRAVEHVSAAVPASDSPKPEAGHARFFFLTSQGVLAAEAEVQALRAGQSPLSPLFENANELVSEFMQYPLGDALVASGGPPSLGDWVKAFAMVAVLGALTYAAWLIPTPWIRWPAVAVGAFFTIAALIIPYAMFVAPRGKGEAADSSAAG